MGRSLKSEMVLDFFLPYFIFYKKYAIIIIENKRR